eukprot:718154-Ditylum_brightwellii.AAC.1
MPNWLKEGTSNIHAIAKGLEDLKKQVNRQLNKKVPDLITLAENYGPDTLDDEVYPLNFMPIQAEQLQDK